MVFVNTEEKERMNEIFRMTSLLTQNHFKDFKEVLRISCDFLKIDTGSINYINGDKYKIEDFYSSAYKEDLKNSVHHLDETYSEITIKKNHVFQIDDIETSDYKYHKCFLKNRIVTYLGVPIWVNGEVYGTLSFFSKTPREIPFNQSHRDFVQYLGQWVSNFIAKTLFEKEIEEKNIQLKKLNFALEENNKMLYKSMQDKEQLSQILVHDLKSPLSNIQMLAYLLEENIKESENDELLGIFNKSLQDVFHLIHQMETLNDVENINIMPNIEEIDLSLFLQEQLFPFSKTAETKNIQLVLNIATDSIKITSDSNIIKRIVGNLLSNAIKFSEFDKQIFLSLKNTENHVAISITDEGPGISPEETPKLFKRFSTLANKPTNNESSSGLGLYIVKELTEKLGGNIYVESTQGVGSTFTVELPLSL